MQVWMTSLRQQIRRFRIRHVKPVCHACIGIAKTVIHVFIRIIKLAIHTCVCRCKLAVHVRVRIGKLVIHIRIRTAETVIHQKTAEVIAMLSEIGSQAADTRESLEGILSMMQDTDVANQEEIRSEFASAKEQMS